jgi:predicted negative regulator of RcsB-dependent stress response
MRSNGFTDSMARSNLRKHFLLATIALLFATYGCEPPRVPRIPMPPSSNPTPAPRPPQPQPSAPLPSPAPPPEAARRPLPQEAKIREQDLRGKAPPPSSPGKETTDSSRQASLGENRAAPDSISPPLPDDSSLLAKITPGVTPQRAASLRLTEEGKKLLDAGEPAKALTRLEKTIVIDSTNAYGYFYLAKAQYRLSHYQQSLNFLDIAESRLTGEPFWLAEINALRGENYRGLGQMQKAEASYMQAIRLNSGNRTAADGLSRLQADIQPISK